MSSREKFHEKMKTDQDVQVFADRRRVAMVLASRAGTLASRSGWRLFSDFPIARVRRLST